MALQLTRFSLCIAALVVALAADVHAQPAWKPEKAVEVIVPTAAGGANDNMARLIQKILHDRKLVPTPVVVMNKAGGNQTLATTYLRQHPADPHYLLYSTSSVFSAQITGLTPHRYTDLAPIALLMTEHTVVSVRADSPIRNMRDLVARLKADTQSIAFGMVSRGGSNHVALAQAVKAAGIDAKRLKTAVFKTNVESYLGVVGGHLDAVVSSATAAYPFMQKGDVRVLGIAAQERQPGELANVPTMREQGIEGRAVTNWRGIFAPPGTTPAQAAFWDEAFAKLVATPDWQKPQGQTNSAKDFLRSRDFVKFLETEYALSKAILTELGFAKTAP
jgi:putative tricarboxylic transport membrane protein